MKLFFPLIITLMLVTTACTTSNSQIGQEVDTSKESANHVTEEIKPELSGHIIDIQNNRILVAYGNVTKKDIELLSLKEILSKTSPQAIWLSLPEEMKEVSFKIGNKVDVWTTGSVDSSYPELAEAVQVVVRE